MNEIKYDEKIKMLEDAKKQIIELSEIRILFNEIADLCNKHKYPCQLKKEILHKIVREIEEIIEKAIEDVPKEIKIIQYEDNNKSLNNEIKIYDDLPKCYYTFDSEMIGNTLEQLLSIMEGKEYSYQKAIHQTYKYESNLYGSESIQIIQKVLLVVQGKNKYEYYYDRNDISNALLSLILKGKGIVIAVNENDYKKEISFYLSKKGTLEDLIVMNFCKYPYINDFINFVVQYRHINKLVDISEKELLDILIKFIICKKESVIQRCVKHSIERREQLIQKMNREKEIEEFEKILKNGVPSRYNNNLIDRLQENENNLDINNSLKRFMISYKYEKNTAVITSWEPLESSENIFIAKINFESSINYFYDDYWDHGFIDINIEDDGIIGIIDISNINFNVNYIIDSLLQSKSYKIDKINDKYLRVLYLPNNGEYKDEFANIDNELDMNKTSYKSKWDLNRETQRMLSYLKEFELVSNFNQNQLKLYKQRKK